MELAARKNIFRRCGKCSLGLYLGMVIIKISSKWFLDTCDNTAPILSWRLYHHPDKRLLDGKKIWQAHSEHCYQLGVRSGMSHARVSSYILLTNIILIAMAVISTFQESVVANIIIILISFLIVAFLLMFFRGRNVN